MRDENKKECSMPVQSRVDLRTLAELLEFMERKKMYIRTISQLVAWSLDLFRDILRMNGVIEHKFETLEDAYDMLLSKGMLQRSMQKRMESKLGAARALENIRTDGWEVNRDLRQFKELHKKGTVVPSPEIKVSDEEYEKVVGYSREEVNRLVSGISDKKEKKEDKSTVFDPSKHKISKDGLIVDVEENLKKMKYNDEKLKDM